MKQCGIICELCSSDECVVAGQNESLRPENHSPCQSYDFKSDQLYSIHENFCF